MRFEFDLANGANNKAKHGIDFVDVQAHWADPLLVEAPAKAEDQLRFLAIGQIDGKHWTAICTLRGKAVRIVSVRRARQEEIGYCEST